MKIVRIDLWHVALPLPAPFRPSWIPGMVQMENRFDLIRLTTSDGVEGWSAAPAMARERGGWGGLLGSYVLGERADDLGNIRQRIREMGYLGYKAGWIEPACWDIVGKARGKAVAELLREMEGGVLGADERVVDLYASTGEVKSGSERVAEVQARMEEGFKAVKLRVHAPTLEEDIEQIETTRKGVGDDVVLGVDANMGWRVSAVAESPRWDFARVLAFCRAAQEAGFRWVEEPLPMDAFDDMVRLRSEVDIAIAGGELNNQGLPEFRVMAERGCYDWYQPDAVMVGGIGETWAIANLVEAAGATYSPHTWTNGIGFAINLQVFIGRVKRAGKFLEYPLNPPGWTPAGRDGILEQPFVHEGGQLRLADAPGLGFSINRWILARFGRRFYTATPTRVAFRTVLDRGITQAKHLGATRGARLAERTQELSKMEQAGIDPMQEGLPK